MLLPGVDGEPQKAAPSPFATSEARGGPKRTACDAAQHSAQITKRCQHAAGTTAKDRGKRD